jgi:hypothetical protein
MKDFLERGESVPCCLNCKAGGRPMSHNTFYCDWRDEEVDNEWVCIKWSCLGKYEYREAQEMFKLERNETNDDM